MKLKGSKQLFRKSLWPGIIVILVALSLPFYKHMLDKELLTGKHFPALKLCAKKTPLFPWSHPLGQ